MDERHVTRAIRAAFRARAAGAASPELSERIRAAVRATRQARSATGTTVAALLVALAVVAAMATRVGGQAPETALETSPSPVSSALLAEPTASQELALASAAPSASVETPQPDQSQSASQPEPTLPSSLQPTASPTARAVSTSGPPPTPARDLVTFEPGPLRVDGAGRVVATDGLRMRSEPTVAEHSLKGELLPAGVRFVVIDGPREADGYRWWYIHHIERLDRRPDGWVAQGSRDGEPWIEGLTATCPAELTSAVLDAIPWQLRTQCYGARPMELTGSLFCSGADAQGGEIVGPGWIEERFECGLIDGDFGMWVGGQPFVDAVRAAKPPYDQPVGRYTVTGHFDDPESGECRWQQSEPEPMAYVVWYCRQLFIASDVRAVP